jgi:protein O-GlcNAc transferase
MIDGLHQGSSQELHKRALANAAANRFDEAKDLLHQALVSNPDDATILYDLGGLHNQTGDYWEALKIIERLVRLRPQDPLIYCHYGNMLKQIGNTDQAVAVLKRGVDLHPGFMPLWSDYLLALNYVDLDSETVLREHRRFGDYFESRCQPLNAKQPSAPIDRLKIGIVSADLRTHAVTAFAKSLFLQHDPERTEIYIYSNSQQSDATTQLLKQHTKVWREIAHLSDAEAAQIIYADQVHALIDFSGHTRGHRLGVFMHKPAPVQISWFGYLCTTGLSRMDYRFVDRELCPQSRSSFYSEQLIALDNSLPYSPLVELPKWAERSPHKPFTLGSFNNFIKVGLAVLRLWKRIMDALPQARLVIHIPGDSAFQESKLTMMVGLGFARNRLQVVADLPPREYLKAIHEVDLALDSFPHGGAVTTGDCLAVGVPVLTLLGERESGRATSSMLKQLGLGEFVAHSEEEYFEIAVRMGRSPQHLSEISKILREQDFDNSSAIRDAEATIRELASSPRTSSAHVINGDVFSHAEILNYLELSQKSSEELKNIFAGKNLSEIYTLFRRTLILRMGLRELNPLPVAFAPDMNPKAYHAGYPLSRLHSKLRKIILDKWALNQETWPLRELFPDDALVVRELKFIGSNVFKSIELQEVDLLIDELLGLNFKSVRAAVQQNRKYELLQDQELYLRLPSHLLQSSYLEIQAIIKVLDLAPNAKLVDLGSGLGRPGFLIGMKFPEMSFVGYEFVSERVAESKRIAALHKMKNVEFIEQDLGDPQFLPVLADCYLVYEPTSEKVCKKILKDLQTLARQSPISIVAIEANGLFLRELTQQSWLQETISRDKNWKFRVFQSHQ